MDEGGCDMRQLGYINAAYIPAIVGAMSKCAHELQPGGAGMRLHLTGNENVSMDIRCDRQGRFHVGNPSDPGERQLSELETVNAVCNYLARFGMDYDKGRTGLADAFLECAGMITAIDLDDGCGFPSQLDKKGTHEDMDSKPQDKSRYYGLAHKLKIAALIAAVISILILIVLIYVVIKQPFRY
ncbi:MAG TPA: hypothetical protein PL033_00100 [Candidatus Brocadiia bacterium]|nr:hypothetical protein [Candidatus Brocadiia bacterium]